MKHNYLKHLFTALFLLCTIVANAYDFEVGGIYYNILSEEDKTVEVTGKTNNYTGSVVIMSSVTYGGITYSVTSIGNSAFMGCSGLSSIERPNSVTSIGNWAFYGCYGLTSIEIPNSVTCIRDYAFCNCSALTSIEIPCSVTSIGSSAFSGCYGLTSIEIPNSVTSIADSTFYYCGALTSIEIPNSVTNIGDYAFCDCGLTSIEIQNCVTSIGNYAFAYCKRLRSIVIGNSVTCIGDCAFSGCTNLNNILIDEGNPKYDSRNNCNAIIESATNTLIVGCFKTIIPNSVTSIGSSAFMGCSGLSSIEIPNSVTSIGNSAFYSCSGLTSIEIPNSVTVIGNEAFCFSNLTSLVIGNSVTTIGKAAFYATNLAGELIIPKSVTNIGDYAFQFCKGITKVICISDIPAVAYYYTFSGISQKATLIVPKGSEKAYADAEGWNYFANIDDNYFYITYKVDGEVYKTEAVAYGTAITLIDEPTKEGHTFSGWSKAPETMPSHDITIEGTFTVNSYTITYMVDDKVYATDSIAYGSNISLPEQPDKEGHSFVEWEGLPETMPAKDITVNAKFRVNSYKVTYVINGNEYASYDVEYGARIPTPENPVKEGHTFSGWSEAPETMPAKDIVIEGSFTINSYTITYMVDGEVYKIETGEYGAPITLIDEPTKEGHTFSGWSEAPETMPAKDITIEGSFTANSYTVTYLVDGDEYAKYTVEYGAEVPVPDNPIKEGYLFEGWTSIPESMPAEDVVIEAIFSIDTGIIVIDYDRPQDVYSLGGVLIKHNATTEDIMLLPQGTYIIGGKKVYIRR